MMAINSMVIVFSSSAVPERLSAFRLVKQIYVLNIFINYEVKNARI